MVVYSKGVFQKERFDFNTSMLLNTGFNQALLVNNYQCFVFSDVDHLLKDDRNIYGCPKQPRHLSVIIDTHGTKWVGLDFHPYSNITHKSELK